MAEKVLDSQETYNTRSASFASGSGYVVYTVSI